MLIDRDQGWLFRSISRPKRVLQRHGSDRRLAISDDPVGDSRLLDIEAGRQLDSDLFTDTMRLEAKRICDGCPVTAACLAAALAANDNPAGIWGGTHQTSGLRCERGLHHRCRSGAGAATTAPARGDSDQEGATLAEIAKRLRVTPNQALGYFSQQHKILVLQASQA